MKVIEYLKNHLNYIMMAVVLIGLAFLLFLTAKRNFEELKNPAALKEFGGGIQNHLVWSINNECYYVRPHNEYTVYLIRVKDCDRK
jgi:hypothetical protein